MRLHVFSLFLLQCLIFYNDLNFARALIGDNVRIAGDEEYLFVVSIISVSNITNEPNRLHRCTATLISRQDVLTSEHCLQNLDTTGYKILMGSSNLRRAVEYYPLFWISYNYWFSHQNARRRFASNDIAITKTNRYVNYLIPHARIYNVTNEELYGSQATLVGWGLTRQGIVPRKLRAGLVTIMTNEQCSEIMTRIDRRQHSVHDRRLCSSANPYLLIRRGDSGGPLIINDRVVAVSQGSGPVIEGLDFRADQVNFHIGTYYYSDFIWDVVAVNHVPFYNNP